MKSISMKIYMSVFALLLTVSALAATTFAWFTLGNTAQVNSFEGDVYAGEGLEVSLIDNNGNAIRWSSYIASEDIKDLIEDNGFVKFKAVTTVNTTSFTTVLIDNGSVDTDVGAAHTDYIKFTLKFRTKQTGATLLWTGATLSGDDDVTWVNDGNPFIDAKGVEVKTNDPVTENVANAARIAVAVVDGTTVLGYELPEEDNNVQGKGTALVGAHSFIKSKYDGIETYYNNAHALATLVVTEDVNTNNQTVVTFGDAAEADADKYVYVTLDVFVWIEGWDANTYNPILGQTLTASLEFKLSAQSINN